MTLPAAPGPKGKLPKPWTLKQYKFVMAYLANGGNAKDAAIKAGYSQKTATEIGAETLTRPHVAAAIAEKTQKVMETVQVSPTDTLIHQMAMAHSDIMDFLTLDKHGRPHVDLKKAGHRTKAIKSIEITELPPMTIVENGQELQREVLKVKLTLHDKPRTNETLMKHLGLLQPDPGDGGTVNNIQNNINVIAANMSEVDIMKRVALMMYRGTLPKVPQAAGGVQSSSGGASTGQSAKSPTGALDKG